MGWAALFRRPPILRGVSASHIRADHAVNQARINATLSSFGLPPAGIHTPVTIKRCGGLLRNGPITRRGIQFRIDRTGPHVVDRDAPAPDLSSPRLIQHL